ncbi:MAG: hypothetical protein ACRDHZ_23415 [Ktedonobacteraceae bacterium]
MNIACLGWGSLIWNAQALPIQQCWFEDGPLLPIEFARHSKDDRITLVLTPGVRHVRSLWTPMVVPDSITAQRELAEREGIRTEDIAQYIGCWSSTGPYQGQSAAIIGQWAARMGLDAVVWTNLPPKFHNEARAPTVEEVLSFLQALPLEAKKRAEAYIRKAPRQIDTAYRRRIEVALHWTSVTAEAITKQQEYLL